MQQNSLFASFAAFQEWIYAICVVFLRANELKFRCVGKSVFIVSFPLFPANDKNSKNWHRNIGRMRFQIEISCFDKKQSSGFEPNCLYQMAVMSQTIIKPNWFFFGMANASPTILSVQLHFFSAVLLELFLVEKLLCCDWWFNKQQTISERFLFAGGLLWLLLCLWFGSSFLSQYFMCLAMDRLVSSFFIVYIATGKGICLID